MSPTFVGRDDAVVAGEDDRLRAADELPHARPGD
jgi:hypothetical protein